MGRANSINYIVIHTSAGYSNAARIQNYFLRSVSKGGKGWNTGGYHRIIEENGVIVKLYNFDTVTNGVRNFNSECIHISYVGGLKKVNGVVAKDSKGNFISEDTRTDFQKQSIHASIQEAIAWLEENGKDITKNLMIVGHRDFSTDKNRNNFIDSNERIKDCPCFNAIPEYNGLYGATNSIQLLPKNR